MPTTEEKKTRGHGDAETRRPLHVANLRVPASPCLRVFLFGCLCLLALSLTACQTGAQKAAATQKIQRNHQGDNAKVDAALDQWPDEAKRPFFATIHAAGHRVVAVGYFDYHNPHDFRITTVTELGQILFDARCNWAGCKVVRIMPGLSETIVELLCRDLSLAWRIPDQAKGLEIRKNELMMSQTDGEHFHFTYYFDPESGRLKRNEIQLGLFDTLTVNVQKYDARGWPTELVLSRPARAYTIQLTFLK